MLTRATRFSALKRWAMGVAKRRGMKRAKVALARKLAVVLQAQNSASIHDLAQTQRTNVTSLWRAICRHARQPVCTIPLDAIGSN